MAILFQFVLRLCFGLALGMTLTSPRQVTSGYYRNHLYVLLGLSVLATMVALGSPEQFPFAPPLVAAVASYLGAVAWLYEKPRAGLVFLAVVSAASIWGAVAANPPFPSGSPFHGVLAWVEPASSGLVLGITIAAMFLGHWYLNTPTMAIGPLLRLVALMAAAVVLRGLVEGASLAGEVAASGWPATDQLLFVALRWLAGIFGTLALAVMTWQTLKIPNTQSATGILYVAVITTFLGELTAMLLAAQSAIPT